MTTVNYPKVNTPSAPPPETPPPRAPPDTFRLTNITQMQRDIEQELAKYTKCKRRYKSAFNVLSYITTGTATIATATAGTGIGLTATGIGAPAGIALGTVSVVTGACSFITNVLSKKVVRKLQKHDSIVALTMAKLSSFRLIINKALTDSTISEEEFNRLQADYDDYKRQKFDLTRKTTTSIDAFAAERVEAIKKEYIKKGYLLSKDNQLSALLNS